MNEQVNNKEQSTEGIESPSIQNITIDNSEVSSRLDKILQEIINDRTERAKEKEQQLKEQKKLEQEQKKLQEQEELEEEERLQKEEQFLNDIRLLTENTDIEHQAEQTELLLQKFDESILMQKSNITFMCVILSALLVMIFAQTFKK